jgi:hypothetical protein
MAFPKFNKDPQSVLDYQVDWSDWLDTDEISTSTWSAPAGITIDSETETDTTATVWLSGGTDGERYEVTNEITTDGGRTDNRTILIVCKQK